MTVAYEKFVHNGLTIKIHQDDDPMSPRTDRDNLTVMIYWHNRYVLGDKYVPYPMTEEQVREEVEGIVAILPLFIYDHSGITVQTRPFADRWDSGQVGWVYVTEDAAKTFGCVGHYTDPDTNKKTEYDKDFFEEQIRGEVATYDQYLRNDVWGFVIEGSNGDHIDSCWGFFGLSDCRDAARESADVTEDPFVQEMADQLASRATYAAGGA